MNAAKLILPIAALLAARGEGGSSAHADTGVGLMLGLAKNLNPHLTLGAEVEWSEQDYRATVQPGLGNPNLARSATSCSPGRR